MKLFFLFLLFVSHPIFQNVKTVYVCDSSNAKKYHLKEHCRGLSNCTYRTIKITLEKAKKEGKTLCGWED